MTILAVSILSLSTSFYFFDERHKDLRKRQKGVLAVLILIGLYGMHIGLMKAVGYGSIYSAYVIIGLILMLLAFEDIQSMIIPIDLLIVGFVMGCILMAINPNVLWYVELLGTLAVFMGAYGFHIITKRGLGMGDVYTLSLLSLFTGWQHTVIVLMISLALVACMGIYMLIFKKVGKRTVLPFVPFLAITHIVMSII